MSRRSARRSGEPAPYRRSRLDPVPHGSPRGGDRLDSRFAQDATAMRGGEAGTLFHDDLGSALAALNPWMSAETVRQVIERLEALPPTIEGNRDMLAWLRGERQWYDDGEKRHRRVRLVDFDTPAANAPRVTWEWKLKPPARKGNRADVMFLVNGMPVAIVEHKNPKDRDATERGITQLRRYEIETPELLGAPQLFNVTHLVDYWYRRDLARLAALHGTLEGAAGGELPVRGTVILRSRRFPAHAQGLDTIPCRRWRDLESRAARAPAPRRRPHRRPLHGADEAPQADLAHARFGKDLHASDRGALDP